MQVKSKKNFGQAMIAVYLGPCQTFTMEFFCKNSQRLKVVNYIHKKAPTLMFDTVLNTLKIKKKLNGNLWNFVYIDDKHIMNKFINYN